MLILYNVDCLKVKRDKPFIERDTSTKTEQVGYVTIGQLVTQMMMSGERLMSYKRQAYDFPEGVFDDNDLVPDPTLDVGFDLADASFYQSSIASKLKKAKAINEARKAAKVADSEAKRSAAEHAGNSGAAGAEVHSAEGAQ